MTSVAVPNSIASALPSLTVLDITNAVRHELRDSGYESGIAYVSEHEVVGLTAGASTPEQLVEATIGRLAALGYDDAEEITVAREDVHFRLPREVAAQ